MLIVSPIVAPARASSNGTDGVGHVPTCPRFLPVSRKPDREPAGRPLLQLDNIRSDGVVDLGDPYLISEADYERWTVRIEARPGDCVLTNVGRVGAAAQIPDGMRAALGRNMTGLRCRPAFEFPTFLIEALRSDAVAAEIALRTDSGTILNSLNVRSIPQIRVAVPPSPVLSRYEQFARPFRARMELAVRERETLLASRLLLVRQLLGESRQPILEARLG